MKRTNRARTFLGLIAAMTFLTTSGAFAALGDHIWSKGFPVGGDPAFDGSGNSVLYGSFFGTIDLGGGPLVSNNFLTGDHYLARFDAAGNHLWSQMFIQSGPGTTDQTLAVDPAGNIYLAGRTFTGTVLDYGGGALADNAVYVVKFDANGTHQWTTGNGEGWVEGLAADNSHVVISGFTSVGVNFGGGLIGDAGGNDIYVAQLSAAGNHVWSAGFGDADDQGAMSVALDGAGNVVIAGSFFGTVDFGGGAAVATGADLFVASFDTGGNHNWSKAVGGEFTLGAGIGMYCNLATGPANEVAVIGDMRNSADFGGGLLTSNGSIDAYCAVFEADGSHRWSANFGSEDSFDDAQGVAINAAGDILITGTFRGDTDFGGGTVLFDGDALNFDQNIYIALYAADGSHLYSYGAGPKAGGWGAHFDAAGDFLIDGRSSAPLDLGGGVISPTGTFLAKFEGPGGGVSAVADLPAFDGSLNGYPNPFNPLTTITYTIAQASRAAISVYDARGRRVADLVPERWHEAGAHEVRFSPQASGVYLVKMRLGGQEKTLKLVAVK